MFINLSKRRAQSTLEYAVLIGIVVAALIAMQIYLKRGYQGKLKAGADDMGAQFDPLETTYSSRVRTFSNSTENMVQGQTTTDVHQSWNNREINEVVGAIDNSDF